jgi:hypothetical protein
MYKGVTNVLVIEQSDLDSSISLDEIGTLVTKEDLIKEEREYFIKRCKELKNNNLTVSGITENMLLELKETFKNLSNTQPPIILYEYKGGK